MANCRDGRLSPGAYAGLKQMGDIANTVIACVRVTASDRKMDKRTSFLDWPPMRGDIPFVFTHVDGCRMVGVCFGKNFV